MINQSRSNNKRTGRKYQQLVQVLLFPWLLFFPLSCFQPDRQIGYMTAMVTLETVQVVSAVCDWGLNKLCCMLFCRVEGKKKPSVYQKLCKTDRQTPPGNTHAKMLTSSRMYSFCSFEIRFRMVLLCLRVRTRAWNHVLRAGSGDTSW